MSEMSDRKSPERRLRFFRFGLLAVTAVAFAVATTMEWLSTLGSLSSALLYGLLWGSGTAVLSVMLYFVYKAFVVKPE